MDFENMTDKEKVELYRNVIKSLIDSLDLEKFKQSFMENCKLEQKNDILDELMKEFENADELEKQCEEFIKALECMVNDDEDPNEENG